MKQYPELLRVKDLAEFLGISPAGLYILRQLPDFPAPRRPTGKRPMYITEEVRQWAKDLKK